jgi:hypothetical protein
MWSHNDAYNAMERPTWGLTLGYGCTTPRWTVAPFWFCIGGLPRWLDQKLPDTGTGV